MAIEPLEALNRAIQANRLDEVTRVLGCEPGMRALGFDSGASRWEWVPEPRVGNPFGTIGGGYIAVFADVLASSAVGGVLAAGELATTAESKTSYLRPAPLARLLGEARVIHRSGRLAFVEARISAETSELVAVASSTWSVIRLGSDAKPRT